MKRETYTIECSNGDVATTQKYNSAIRKIETMVKAVAVAEKTTYRLTHSSGEKSDGLYYYVSGSRVWTGDNGRVLTYSIKKTA